MAIAFDPAGLAELAEEGLDLVSGGGKDPVIVVDPFWPPPR